MFPMMDLIISLEFVKDWAGSKIILQKGRMFIQVPSLNSYLTNSDPLSTISMIVSIFLVLKLLMD
jgi:hypothetical protein